jgi:hypothetical protein
LSAPEAKSAPKAATGSLFGKTGVESAREWFGPRQWARGTNSTERFGDAITLLYGLHADSKAIDTENNGMGPGCELTELRELAEFMADVRAGIDGWETYHGIRALEAAVDGRTIVQNPALRRGEDS